MLNNKIFIASLLSTLLFLGYNNHAIADSAEIVIENMTSVQIPHQSFASVLINDTLHTLLPDHYEKITVPTNTLIIILLHSLSFDDRLMDPSHFDNCKKTFVLQDGEVINMYMVGKVPEGIIECRYY